MKWLLTTYVTTVPITIIITVPLKKTIESVYYHANLWSILGIK